LKVEISKNIDFNEYDNIIQKTPYSSFYQTKNHLIFLKDLLKITPHFIQVKNENKIIGVMPFFSKKSKFGMVINSLPFFGSYGGFVENVECNKLILEELNNFNSENDVISSVIIPNPFIKDESSYRKFFSYTLTDSRLIQCLELNNRLENDLWKSFEQRVRRAIRKSQKLNIQIKKTELTDNIIDDFYQMHKNEIKTKGGKIKPSNFFSIVKDRFSVGQDYEILCANKDGVTISYLLVFYHNNFAEYYMPAYDPVHKNTQSTSLLIWNSILNSLNHKVKFYNFGGTWKNQSALYRFKRGWNSKDFKYNYYIYCDLDKIKEIGIKEISKYYEFFYIAPYEQLS